MKGVQQRRKNALDRLIISRDKIEAQIKEELIGDQDKNILSKQLQRIYREIDTLKDRLK
jgi:hypothetical protein